MGSDEAGGSSIVGFGSFSQQMEEAMRKVTFTLEVLEARIAPGGLGSLGYEGQPGNQGNGTKGYEGQPGNQGNGAQGR
jgi:hypothetical protein